jgi:glycerate 2-kinase
MLLGFLQKLQLHPKSPLKNMKYVIISGAFDGIEGNSGAMGAIIDSTSLKRAAKKHLNISEYLDQNNSFEFFKQLDDVIISGQTGTNVNDMTLILIDKKKSLSEGKEKKLFQNLPTYW